MISSVFIVAFGVCIFVICLAYIKLNTFNYRSLPELSLLKETSVRGVKYSPSKANSLPESIICSSKDGELLVV